MALLYGLSILCVAVSTMTAFLRNRSYEKVRFVSKMIASLLFCLIAGLAVARREAPLNVQVILMLCALVLGLLGDIFLGLDHLVAERLRGLMFLLGGIPFFFGHVLYIVLLLSYGNVQPWLLLLVPLVPAVCYLLKWRNIVQPGKRFWLLISYSVVLGTMMLSTLNLAIQGGPLGRLMILPGILFTISDSTLFIGKYCNEKLKPLLPVFSYTVMLPYYAAQSLFALSLLYL